MSSPISKGGLPFAALLRLTATRVVPAGFVLGAVLEAIMGTTGFWSVATRKAAERQYEAQAAATALSAPGTPRLR